MKFTLNAKTLRIVLLASILLLVAGSVVGFVFARNKLQAFATSISQMEAGAASVDTNVTTLKQLEVTLKGIQDVKDKTSSLTVPASEYPVSVIANITEIASQTGVKLNSINYGDSAGATNGTTPATSGAAAGTAPGTTPGAAAGAPTAPQTTAPSGVTKKTVNVTVASPIDYDSLMNFIKGIETNDMYMQIAKISLTKADGKSVNIQPLTIEVYTK